jgi:hypothetical protein
LSAYHTRTNPGLGEIEVHGKDRAMYKELSARLQCLASTPEEFERYKEYVTQYWEGKTLWQNLPNFVKLALVEWEQENIRRAS